MVDLLKLIHDGLIKSSRYHLAIKVQERINKLEPSEENNKHLEYLRNEEKKRIILIEKRSKFQKFLLEFFSLSDMLQSRSFDGGLFRDITIL